MRIFPDHTHTHSTNRLSRISTKFTDALSIRHAISLIRLRNEMCITNLTGRGEVARR